MRILQQTEFKDVLWNVDSKILIIKMLFEQKEYDTIPFQIKSLKMYLYRQKNIGYFKTIHQKTLHYFEILYKGMLSGKLEKENLLSNISDEKNLVEKDWFLEMLEKL